MNVKFKNDTRTFECTEPLEQKLFKAGTAAGWLVTFSIYGDINSTELDGLITSEGISELTFTANNSGSTMEFILEGYSKVTSCVIRHKENMSVSELQLTKMDESDTSAVPDEGGAGNG